MNKNKLKFLKRVSFYLLIIVVLSLLIFTGLMWVMFIAMQEAFNNTPEF